MRKLLLCALALMILSFTLVSCYDPANPLGQYIISDHVTLGQYLEISYTPANQELTEKDITAALFDLQDKHKATQNVTDRPAENGDQVTVSYTADVNGQTLSSTTGETLILGAAKTNEKADQYIVHETNTVNLTYPTDFSEKKFAGLTCTFKITLISITAFSYPALTDDFISKNTDYDTLEKYVAYLHTSLAEKKKAEAVSENLNTVWNQVIENASFQLPEERVQKYADQEHKALDELAKKEGMTVEAFLETKLNVTLSSYQEYIRSVCERRVKEEFAFYAIAEKEGILLTDEEFQTKAEKLSDYYGSDLDTFLKTWGDEYIRITLQGQKVMEYVLEKAIPTTK